MTKEQAQRLDEIIVKYDLDWWEVQEKIGVSNLNDQAAIETAIKVLEKMGAAK